MEIFDNSSKFVKNDLVEKIAKGSRVSIASACFSMYAFEELRKQLESCGEVRFLFTSPSFLPEKAGQPRKFSITKRKREKSLYGTEFELHLRNELKQEAIARECAAWVREKVRFRSNITSRKMEGFVVVDDKEESYVYSPVNSFTTVNLGSGQGEYLTNVVARMENPASAEFLKVFNSIWSDRKKVRDVTQEVLEMISAAYEENAPEMIYFLTVCSVFSDFLEDVSSYDLANEATGFKESVIWNKLYNFQKDAALTIINRLDQFNGCILADSVGLGKTFTALAVIKYYEGRNKNVLVLCPKKLSENWMTFRGNLLSNPLAEDRLRYDVLYHTDLSRKSGDTVIGLPIESINWGNYDLVVIDESHNFRNGVNTANKKKDKENRYEVLLNRIIKPGIQTKVLMLSATPVNNRFHDLRNQLALAYEGDASRWKGKLNIRTSVDDVFRRAQQAYNEWARLPEEERTTQNLLSRLSFDFIEVLDSVTIARSRRHLRQFYDLTEIGSFPERMRPISRRPVLTNLLDVISYGGVYAMLNSLQLSIYTPMQFVYPDKLFKYMSEKETKASVFAREAGLQCLMSTNLLKRLESSAHSFLLTLQRIHDRMVKTSRLVGEFLSSSVQMREESDGSMMMEEDFSFSKEAADFDEDDQNSEFFITSKKIKIDLRDMDCASWKRDMDLDIPILEDLINKVKLITYEYDNKLSDLLSCICDKVRHPVNPGNSKILIFTAFADTAEYLYEHVSRFAKENLGLNTALITGGSASGRTTIPKGPREITHILRSFSPASSNVEYLYENGKAQIDILIATDCISEGQNLQDCDYCINYDIHWNPVRIIQRFGRIDRIGSKNERIQLVNYWPDVSLDTYLDLKARVEEKMRITIMTATGDDDPINMDETGDLEYRRTQLRRLQEEVVDLEEMTEGISITDLGLNDFRLDYLTYRRDHGDLDRLPPGIHAVVRGAKPGVIFTLKNVNAKLKIENQNQLYPYYLVYVGIDGKVIADHNHPKEILDVMRKLCKGKSLPDVELCGEFNKETANGRFMRRISRLLTVAVDSIIRVNETSTMDSVFKPGNTSLLSDNFKGVDDFELVSFLAVR